MSDSHYDVVVVGTGPGGEGAAMQAVKLGKRVAVVERMPRVGGACTHQATIPSKALRHAITQMTAFNSHPLNRRAGVVMNLSFQDLLSSSRSVIERQVEMRRGFYERNAVPVIQGSARFVSAHQIEAVEPDGAVQRLTAGAAVIAVGSRPYRPPEIDFTHPRVHDSDTILSMTDTPSSITIYGAGVVGCEYASMFKNLGVKVNLINTRGRLLEFLDDEITDALGYHLRDQGVLIRHNETSAGVEAMDDGVVLSLRSGKKIKSAALLWANGRTGNTNGLGLEAIGIKPNVRGQIDVNENFQTALPNIYAVGDVVGAPALASAAYVQGRFAAMHVITGKAEQDMVRDIPTGIYTTPEISSIGRTESELTAAGVPYEVGHALFKSLARAQISGQTAGMLKLLFHRETLEILGIHCFGENASEIIHIGQAIMAQPAPNNSLEYFLRQTFNYPTMAEAYRVAALNGYNRLF